MFRQAAAAVLARSAPEGVFDVREPEELSDSSITADEMDGDKVYLAQKRVSSRFPVIDVFM